MSDHSEYLLPPRRSRRLWFFASACVVASMALGQAALDSWTELQRTRRQIGQLSVTPPAPPKPSRAEVETHARWAALQQERDFRWYPLFAALEGASSDDIELLEFQPEKSNGKVILRGEARTVEALFDYAQSLSEQPAFASAVLLRQKKKQRDSLLVIAFEIETTLAPSRLRRRK